MQVTIIKHKLPGRLLYNSHLLHFFKRRFLSAGLSYATAPVNDALTCDDINIQFPENENPIDKPEPAGYDEKPHSYSKHGPYRACAGQGNIPPHY